MLFFDAHLPLPRLAPLAGAWLLVLAACGARAQSAPAPDVDGGGPVGTAVPNGDCVDVVLGEGDVSCQVDGDCTFVNALHLCAGDPECGFENPVNFAGATRYTIATSGVPLKSVICGVPAPVGCVHGACVEVPFRRDAGSADASSSADQ